MDWSKIEAGLAGALADGEPDDRFVVFVHLVAPGDADLEVEGLAGQGPVRTAVVSGADVDRLSERPEVGQLRLSRPLPAPGCP